MSSRGAFSVEKPLSLGDEKWQVKKYHIKVMHVIGTGNFGQVWKGEGHDSLDSKPLV